jgi:hypothetical protein
VLTSTIIRSVGQITSIACSAAAIGISWRSGTSTAAIPRST